MERCFNRTFSSLRPQPHSRSPRSLRKAREVAEQAQSIERKRFKEPTGPLLWAGEAAPRVTQLLSAREASPRTILFDRPEDRFFYAAIDFWTAACSFAGRME